MLYPSAVNDNGSDRRRPIRLLTLERPVRPSECLEGEIGRLQAKADRARLDVAMAAREASRVEEWERRVISELDACASVVA